MVNYQYRVKIIKKITHLESLTFFIIMNHVLELSNFLLLPLNTEKYYESYILQVIFSFVLR